MPASIADIYTLLEQIDILRVDYELRAQKTGISGRNTEQANGHGKAEEKVLEEMIDEEFTNLEVREKERWENVDTISLEAARQIIEFADEAVNCYGLLRLGINSLKRLKEEAVRQEMEKILQQVSRRVIPQRNVYRNMDIFDADYLGFPQLPFERIEAAKAGYIAQYKDLWGEVDPDTLHEYLVKAQEAVKLIGDSKAGSVMMKHLAESLINRALTPSMRVKREENAEEEIDVHENRSNYLRLLLQMEEMRSRLSVFERNWESDQDYRQGLDDFKEQLEHVRSRIGSRNFIRDVYEGDVNPVNILKQTALEGPLHLHMAQEYIRIFSSEIRNRVFGETSTIDEHVKPNSFIVIKEPRRFIRRAKLKMGAYGISEDDEQLEVVDPGVDAIVTSDILVGMPPQKIGDYYAAVKYTIISFYEHSNASPRLLRQLSKDNIPQDSVEFVRELQKARLPRGTVQAEIEDVYIFKERDLSDMRPVNRRVKLYSGGKSSDKQELISKVSRMDKYTLPMTWDEFRRKQREAA